MNYKETLHFLYSQLPVFQKDGASALKNKLDNILSLCESLGNPQDELTCIHVGGTNGKGSVSHMLAAVLMKHQYKVGLYTSPHLKSFTERIKINTKEIPEESVIQFVELIKSTIHKIKPSFFEVTVAMAFWYFNQKKVDYVILEVGMGGRLDSTNIIDPLLSVITNISLDHQQYLGDTIEKIAFEKAGIIKPNKPIVIGEKQKESFPVFEQIAKEKKAPLIVEDSYVELFTKLKTNTYQDKNTSTALKACAVLKDLGIGLSGGKILEALSNFQEIAGLKGRWQKLSDSPLIYCDTGHNEAGVKEIVSQLETLNFSKLLVVWGMAKDKEVSKVLSLLPQNAYYFFCQAAINRAMPVEELSCKAKDLDLHGESYESVDLAIEMAKSIATKDDLILIGGSNFVVAEIPFL